MESGTPISSQEPAVRRSPRLNNTASHVSTGVSPVSARSCDTSSSPNTTQLSNNDIISSDTPNNSSPTNSGEVVSSRVTSASVPMSDSVLLAVSSASGGSSEQDKARNTSASCAGGNSGFSRQPDSLSSEHGSTIENSPDRSHRSAAKLKKRLQPSQHILEDPLQVCDDASGRQRGRTAVVFDDRFLLHENAWQPNHPESPRRLRSILQQCEEWGLLSRCLRVPARLASQAELQLGHSAEYIDTIRSLCQKFDVERARAFCFPHDVFLNEASFDAASLAVGSAVELVDQIIENEIQNAFLFARPPGHHALQDSPSGYCLFNQAAIAARRAIDRHQRVLVVDWDVHFGQGTQAILAPYQQAFCFSVHRYENGQFWPHLPDADSERVLGVGADGQDGCKICNVPLNTDGVSDVDMLAVWNRLLLPMAYEFSPDLVIVSAGFDMAIGDPKGEMCVSPACFGHLTHSLQALAGGRMLCVLEGGYNVRNTALSAAHTLRSLLGFSPSPLSPSVSAVNDSVEFSITKAIYHHRESFHCLSIYPVYDADVNLRKRQLSTAVPLTEFHWPLVDPDQLVETHVQGPAEMSSRCSNSEVAPSSDRDSKTVGLFSDERMLLHRNISDTGHPECAERVSSILSQLHGWGLTERCRVVRRCQPASVSQLTAVHSQQHVQSMADTADTEQSRLDRLARGFNSVYLCPDSYQAALLSAGCIIQAVDGVMSGQLSSAMCVCRPPGHHAERDCAHGFCVFNSVAVAALHAINHHRLDRVLIVDWDVHHGNGIQHVFYSDSRVLYISLHRYDQATFFPCSEDAAPECVGAEGTDGVGFNVNIAWNGRRLRGEEYLSAFLAVVLPVLGQWQPQLVLVASGFDAARGDPLGGYSVAPEVYGHLSHHLARAAGGRLVLALEGGYCLPAISYSTCMCVKALLGDPLVQLPRWQPLRPSAVDSLAVVMAVQRKYWRSVAAVTSVPRQSLLQLRAIEQAAPLSADDPCPSQHVTDLMARLSLDQATSADSLHCERSLTPERVECVSASAADNDTISAMYAVVPLSDCPHLTSAVCPLPDVGIITDRTCLTCATSVENWSCLTCYQVFCGRYSGGHMVDHYERCGHPMVLSFSDLSVWCYGCDAYVHNELLLPAKQSAHCHKFSQSMPF